MATSSTTESSFRWRNAAIVLAVLGLFAVSGACGLLYQIVWTRKLVLLFGTTSYAVSTVLSIFFLGLALGSLWGGRLAHTSRRPLALYGVFEIGIGLWAVLFILLLGYGEGAIVWLLRLVEGGRGAGIGLRALMAFVLLFVPVTLMGATLPLLARFVARAPRTAGLRVGALYSINTLGAVAGCALTGFVLLAAFGYTVTTIIGAVANLAAGLGALALHWAHGRMRGEHADAEAADSTIGDPPAGPEAGRGALVLVMIVFAVSGFSALALEVVWTRLLAILFTGTTYAYTTMLASILLGIAAGGAVGGLAADRFRRHVFWFGLAEVLAGAACLATLLAFKELPEIFAEMRQSAGFDWQRLIRVKFTSTFIIVFAPLFFFGATFPLAVKAAAKAGIGRDVGRLYFANTMGGVFGAAAGGFLLIPLLGSHWTILAMGGLLCVAGLAAMFWDSGAEARRRRILSLRRIAAAVAAAGVAAMFAAAARGDVGLLMAEAALPRDNILIDYEEGVEGTVGVSQEDRETAHTNRVLWVNGVQATASIEKGVRMNRLQGVLPLLFNRDPQDVLIMCFGSGITAGTLALGGFDHIDAVELVPAVYDAAEFFGEDNFNVMKRPGIDFIVDDGRNFLLTTEKRYDFITFEPMPLALAGVSTFYTEEYYRLCLERLTPSGMVSQWVPLHSLNPEVVRSLVYTFTRVFPYYCAFFVNADLFLVGSAEPLLVDYEAAYNRTNTDAVQEALEPVELDRITELLSAFIMDQTSIDAFAAGGAGAPPPRVMVDDRPWAEFEAPKLMYERTVQESLQQLMPHQDSPTALLDMDSLPEGDGPAIVEALNRRARARALDLEGLRVYYGGTFGSQPEKHFLDALKIDPGDRTALYYLRQIAEARIKLYIRWDDLDKAEEMLSSFMAAVPTEPLFPLLMGDVLVEAERDAEAAGMYRRHLELGGTARRAAEFVG